jgi:hypothetical protein
MENDKQRRRVAEVEEALNICKYSKGLYSTGYRIFRSNGEL